MRTPNLFNLEERFQKRMEGSIKMVDLVILENIMVERIVSSYKIHRKSFLKVMMWFRVLRKIKIVFMLSNPPFISIMKEDLSLIRDGYQVVSNSPRSTCINLMARTP